MEQEFMQEYNIDNKSLIDIIDDILFLEFVEKIFRTISAKSNPKAINDILLNSYIRTHQIEYEIYNKLQNLQMKIGKIWEIIIGMYKNYRKCQHGIDIINLKKKIAIELKNRNNSDNYSSKIQNFKKLLEFKRKHPDYRVIYGCINGERKTLNHKSGIIELHGMDFLEFIFTDNSIIRDIIKIANRIFSEIL